MDSLLVQYPYLEELLKGILGLHYTHIIMWIIGGILIWLAVKYDYEPALLLPIGFGRTVPCTYLRCYRRNVRLRSVDSPSVRNAVRSSCTVRYFCYRYRRYLPGLLLPACFLYRYHRRS